MMGNVKVAEARQTLRLGRGRLHEPLPGLVRGGRHLRRGLRENERTRLSAMCAALARLASANSAHLVALAKVCGEVCLDCEKECRKHEKEHELCKACA